MLCCYVSRCHPKLRETGCSVLHGVPAYVPVLHSTVSLDAGIGPTISERLRDQVFAIIIGGVSIKIGGRSLPLSHDNSRKAIGYDHWRRLGASQCCARYYLEDSICIFKIEILS